MAHNSLPRSERASFLQSKKSTGRGDRSLLEALWITKGCRREGRRVWIVWLLIWTQS
jgi:hypothetical protein